MKKVFAVALIVLFVLMNTVGYCEDRPFDYMSDEDLLYMRELIDIELIMRGIGLDGEPIPEGNNAQDLESRLMELPLVITEAKYITYSKNGHKSLDSDELSVIVRNDSGKDIRDLTVAYVAWDENNLPVKIVGFWDFSGGSYLEEIRYNDVNLIPGATFGEGRGFSLEYNSKIHTFKAIVVSYETFDNETWVNPYYKEFREMYEGKKLTQ